MSTDKLKRQINLCVLNIIFLIEQAKRYLAIIIIIFMSIEISNIIMCFEV